MAEWLDESAFTVFLSIGGAGLAFLVFTLIVGELGELLDGMDGDHGGGDASHEGPSVLSSRVIAMFVTALGGAGAIATHYGLSVTTSSAIGFAGGTLFGGAAFLFARFLHSRQATSGVRVAELVGQTARVVVAIPQGGVGQVRCHIGEDLIDKIARTRDGSALPEHALVRIEELVGEVVIVSPA